MVTPNKPAFRGFSLSEILISLSVLGLIGTFNVNKVLTAQQNHQKKAIFKECFEILHKLGQDMMFSRIADTGPAWRAFVEDRLQFTKKCSTNPQAEGCWSGVGGDATNISAYVLPSGASMTSFNRSMSYGNESVGIDWNGTLPPNVQGDDQLWMFVCWGTAALCPVFNSKAGPGVIGPLSAVDEVLYLSVLL
jgi:prepilin-type N-terminal cleavage/methylation domain-containing protein